MAINALDFFQKMCYYQLEVRFNRKWFTIMDKRIVRTRVAIFNAVFELATEKQISKITVIELCERAGINKSTFYLHYKSMDDCIQQCFDFFTNKIIEIGKGVSYEEFANAPESMVKATLDLVENNMKYFNAFKDSAIYDSGIKLLKDKLVRSICESNDITIENNYHEVAKITFLVGGCADIILKMMPNFNRAEIEKIMLSVIRRRTY